MKSLLPTCRARCYLLLLSVCALGATVSRASIVPNQVWYNRSAAELQKRDPGLVPVFSEGFAGLRDSAYARADSLLGVLVAAVPDFAPGLQLRGLVWERQGKVLAAMDLFEQARFHRSDAFARLCLADGVDGSQRAMDLAREAIVLAPDDPVPYVTLARIAVEMGADRRVGKAHATLEWAADELMTRFTDDGSGYYFAAIAAKTAGEWDRARVLARWAVARGAPEWVLDKIEERRGTVARWAPKWTLGRAENHVMPETSDRSSGLWRWLIRLLALVALWAASLLLIYLVGRVLAGRALGIIGADGIDMARLAATHRLRTAYRRLLTLAGAYYHASIFFMVVVLVALAALLIAFRIAGGTVPMVLVIGSGLAALVSFLTAAIALAAGDDEDPPGRLLVPGDAPELDSLLLDVAAEVGTPPIIEVWLDPLTDIAIYEKGRVGERLRDRGHRVLILGVNQFAGFDLNAFRGVLVHEYAHFLHDDPAAGQAAARVLGSTASAGMALESIGLSTYWNVSYWFVALFHSVMARIAAPARRLSEMLADRVAAEACGYAVFAAGLEHILRRGIALDLCLEREFEAALEEDRAPGDIFGLVAAVDAETGAEIEKRLAEAMAAPAADFDTHPSPADRLRHARHVAGAGGVSVGTGTVWDLFTNRTMIETAMNAVVAEAFARYKQMVDEKKEAEAAARDEAEAARAETDGAGADGPALGGGD